MSEKGCDFRISAGLRFPISQPHGRMSASVRQSRRASFGCLRDQRSRDSSASSACSRDSSRSLSRDSSAGRRSSENVSRTGSACSSRPESPVDSPPCDLSTVGDCQTSVNDRDSFTCRDSHPNLLAPDGTTGSSSTAVPQQTAAKAPLNDVAVRVAQGLQPPGSILGCLQGVLNETEDSLSAITMSKKGREVAQELYDELEAYRSEVNSALAWANDRVGKAMEEAQEQQRRIDAKTAEMNSVSHQLEDAQKDLNIFTEQLAQNQQELEIYERKLQELKRRSKARKRRGWKKTIFSATAGVLFTAVGSVFPPAYYLAGASVASSGLFAGQTVCDAKQAERLCAARRADINRHRSLVESTQRDISAKSSSVATLKVELTAARNSLDVLRNRRADLEEYRDRMIKAGEALDSISSIVGRLCAHSEAVLNSIYTDSNKFLVRMYAGQLRTAKENFRTELQAARNKYQMMVGKYGMLK